MGCLQFTALSTFSMSYLFSLCVKCMLQSCVLLCMCSLSSFQCLVPPEHWMTLYCFQIPDYVCVLVYILYIWFWLDYWFYFYCILFFFFYSVHYICCIRWYLSSVYLLFSMFGLQVGVAPLPGCCTQSRYNQLPHINPGPAHQYSPYLRWYTPRPTIVFVIFPVQCLTFVCFFLASQTPWTCQPACSPFSVSAKPLRSISSRLDQDHFPRPLRTVFMFPTINPPLNCEHFFPSLSCPVNVHVTFPCGAMTICFSLQKRPKHLQSGKVHGYGSWKEH